MSSKYDELEYWFKAEQQSYKSLEKDYNKVCKENTAYWRKINILEEELYELKNKK
tara:strand:+ start:62 stop:226 length:165 start_codon:yes stop_codon:yes gene_type:complete